LTGFGASVGLGFAAEAWAAPAPFCGAVVDVPSWAFTMPWQEEIVNWEGFSTWTRLIGKNDGGGLFGFFKKDSPK
jgi:hypothetical protein